ncbi:hypothetical protein, partial [Bathymodiolus platifrons methanotrophic gill symbiont]|uniref:hypothetical protein n=1 Tax=Bathymodiolus platifrons methanotrophic gill symbiont TaxID=113268 RepID=UPI001C8ED01C
RLPAQYFFLLSSIFTQLTQWVVGKVDIISINVIWAYMDESLCNPSGEQVYSRAQETLFI